MNEKDRLDFVEERDGLEAAIKFAQQNVCLYIKASIDQGHYKDSVDEYKKFLDKHGFEVQITIFEKNNKDAGSK